MDQAPLVIEKAREERINSNMERMKQLGILNLSRDVNSVSQFLTPKKRGSDMPIKEKPIETSNITTKKRGRGRPRKEIRPIETSNITTKKRGRGRPRKEIEPIETSNITTKKRGRGRPRKEIGPIETSKITPNITPRNQWHLRTRSTVVKMDQAPLGIEKGGEERQTQIETSNITPEKRGRGRPGNHHESTCEAPSIDTLNVKIEEVNATSEKEEK